MTITHCQGDPLLTRAQTLAFAYNAQAKTEQGALETRLYNAHPTAFANYRKHVYAGKISAGDVWVWQQNQPALCFMVVRESGVGALRLRYLQTALLRLAHEYTILGIKSLAFAPMGTRREWVESRALINTWLARARLSVVIYDHYLPGVVAEESCIQSLL
jgi:hypothetical protein